MRLLFAEDDPDLRRAVRALLEHALYTVDEADNGLDALDMARENTYDGLILDWMMPGLSGVEVLRKLREAGKATPCLMLTARDSVEDRVTGLDAGADDYLPKPFSTAELLARIRALVRRRESYTPDILRFEDLSLDRSSLTLKCEEKEVRLTNKAFQLMELFMVHPHQVMPVNTIMDRVWGFDSDAEINVVWVNISMLRKRLAELGCHAEIRASRGAGYALEKKDTP